MSIPSHKSRGDQMPPIIYNKLVRDKIPEIICQDGKTSNHYTLSESDFKTSLNVKLVEECNEWLESGDISELADILEVIEALMNVYGTSWEEVMRIKAQKRLSRGGFDQRIFLQDVRNSDDSENELDKRQLDSSYQCVGIDACKGKWVAVAISDRGFEVQKYETIADICERYPDCHYMLIDIPVGLRDHQEQLRPDALVKRLLGPKSASIFEVPCRKAVYATTKEAARAINIEVLGKSLSEQSIGFSKAIRQVDEFLISHETWKNKILESHPEFCFMKLNKGKPIHEKKTTFEGQERRLEVLETYYPKARDVMETFLHDVPSRKKVDDVIDALCLAIMGKLMLENGIQTIPELPEKDANGIEMKIVFGSADST